MRPLQTTVCVRDSRACRCCDWLCLADFSALLVVVGSAQRYFHRTCVCVCAFGVTEIFGS